MKDCQHQALKYCVKTHKNHKVINLESLHLLFSLAEPSESFCSFSVACSKNAFTIMSIDMLFFFFFFTYSHVELEGSAHTELFRPR